MILKRTSLTRRKVLRGAGASLALPLLEAMQVNSFSKTNEAVKPPVRAGFFYIPNGVVQTAWHPKDTGKGYELSPTLEPIRPIKNDVTLFTKLDRVKVAGFDEDDVTLQGIKNGTVIGTVVQNPYEYGYQSVRVLSELLKGNKKVIPASKYIDVPARAVTKDGRKIGGKPTENVDEFWADLKEKVGN